MTTISSNVRPFSSWIVACGALTALVGCDQFQRTNDPPAAAAEEEVPSVENIDKEPNRFLGQRVVINGEIGDVHSNRSFELKEPTLMFGNEVLVLARTPIRLGVETLSPDMAVQVAGTVRKLVITEVERELGWDLEPQLEVEWETKPVVIADDIRAVHKYARWSETDTPKGKLVSLWAVYAAPKREDLAGSSVDLEGVRVAATGVRGLWIGIDNHPSVFVVPDDAKQLEGVEEGTQVDIDGSLERIPETGDTVAQWKLDAQDKRRLDEATLYLRATEIRKVPEKDKRAASDSWPPSARDVMEKRGGSGSTPEAPRDTKTL